MMSAREDSRKQVAYLMLKQPSIDNDNSGDEEDSQDRTSKQKRSFDYSNYVHNKRLQMAKEQELQQRQKSFQDSEKYEVLKMAKQLQLAAKTAKKRAIRKARRVKHATPKKSNPECEVTETASDSNNTKPLSTIDRLKQDQDIKELGI